MAGSFKPFCHVAHVWQALTAIYFDPNEAINQTI